MNKKILILASASKRRAKILRECRIRFKAAASGVEEIKGKGRTIKEAVQINARRKAVKIAKKSASGVILGVDTMVLLDGSFIGKPKDLKEARLLLEKLSTKKIDVYTGLYIIDKYGHKAACGYEKSSLRVAFIKKSEIDNYLRYLGPFDKAGGFSIEGAGSFIFDSISGSYFNILGLPMGKLCQLLKKIGIDIFEFIKK